MSNIPVFNIINMENWPRKSVFDHYYHNVKCTYSITVNIDISNLLVLCKKKSIKLYSAMIYFITNAINQIEELRISYNDEGQLGIWSFMSPSYTVFHKDDKSFSSIWTQYDQNFVHFNRNHLQDIERYGAIKGLIAKEQAPANTFSISCIPWIDFTSFNLNIYDNAYYLRPIFTLGEYSQHGNKVVIPVAVQLHHAICDGYHAGLLFQLLKKFSFSPEEFINI